MTIVRYIIHNLWLLDLFFLLVVPLLVMLVGWKRRRKAALLLTVLMVGTYLYGRYVGTARLEVRRVQLSFADLPEAFDGYRLVHVSDLHAGSITHDLLRRVVDSINAQKADMVVFTGDMQNVEPRELEPLLPQLKRLKAPDGICSVLGNHDYGDYAYGDDFERTENIGRLMYLQEEMGWYVLANEHRKIRRGSQRLVIGGMENDGEGRFPQRGDIGSTLNGVRRSDFVIMLEHDPTSWRRKILPHCHAQLTLSGHTHGGQLALFGWSPASLRYREYEGAYSLSGRYLYVTKGLSGAIPFRLGVSPEIVVIELKKL